MSAQALAYGGRTREGHYRLLAASKSRPGRCNAVLVSRDGSRVSCGCTAAQRHPLRKDGRVVLSRTDVLAGTVDAGCWHVREAARWSPRATIAKGTPVGDRSDALFVEAPEEPFGWHVADARRVARLIARSGHRAEIERQGADRRAWSVVYCIDRHEGEWTPGEWCEWHGASILRAVETLGFGTRSTADAGELGEALYTVEAWRIGDPRVLAHGSGSSRTDAAVALALAIERLTQPCRRRPQRRRA